MDLWSNLPRGEFRASTPDGPAVITVSQATDARHVTLRSRVTGLPDVYAAFRQDHHRTSRYEQDRWMLTSTIALSPAECAPRPVAAYICAPLAAWLDGVTADA